MGNGSGVSRGDRNRNARLTRLRGERKREADPSISVTASSGSRRTSGSAMLTGSRGSASQTAT